MADLNTYEENGVKYSNTTITLDSDDTNLTLLNYDDSVKKTGSEIDATLSSNSLYSIYGHPEKWDLDYDQIANDCGIDSVRNILAQANNILEENDVFQRALDLDLCIDHDNDNQINIDDPDTEEDEGDGNTYESDLVQLLTSYGVTSRIETYFSLTGLADAVKSGYGVIVRVDAEILWKKDENDEVYGNHIITVTGVVYDENNNLVGFYICDSGRGDIDDKARYIDKDSFEEAWDVNVVYDGTNEANRVAVITNNIIKEWSNNIDATGNALDNEITGNDGNNELTGMGGADTLIGGEGNDFLFGGADNDTIDGGEGRDIYVFSERDGQDRIIDSDGKGVVVYDDKILSGGVRKLAA